MPHNYHKLLNIIRKHRLEKETIRNDQKNVIELNNQSILDEYRAQ